MVRDRLDVLHELSDLTEGLIDGLGLVEGDSWPDAPATRTRLRELLDELDAHHAR